MECVPGTLDRVALRALLPQVASVEHWLFPLDGQILLWLAVISVLITGLAHSRRPDVVNHHTVALFCVAPGLLAG